MKKPNFKSQAHSKTAAWLVALLIMIGFSAGRAAVWTSAANGAWNSGASWTLVSGTPTSSYPTSADQATITHTINIGVTAVCQGLTINAGGYLSFTAGQSLVVNGNFTNNGTVTASSAVIYFGTSPSTPSAVVTQNGIMNGGGYTFRFRPYGRNITVASGTTLNASQLAVDGAGSVGGTVTNQGTLNINNVFVVTNGATLNNGANGTMNIRINASVTNGGVFSATGSPNTVNYSGTGWTTIHGTTYHHLNVSNSGTTLAVKALGGAMTVNGNFTLNSNVRLNCNNANITINGTWINNNTTSTLMNTGGTFTFGGTNPSYRRLTNSEAFGNVVVACTGSFTPNSTSTAGYTGNFSCSDLTLQSGTLDLNATGNYTVTVRGNMSSTGGALAGQNGYITFGGTAAQTISGNAITFSNINVNNAAGVSTSSAHSLTGTLLVASGTFTSNTADFTLVSDASTGITARIGSLTTGSVAGSSWVVQRRVLTTGSSSSAAYWADYASPVSGATLSDWDSEMYLSAVGGSDGTACCPTFYSVKQWNNGGADYTNVTSLIPLVTGYGYTIWTATTLSTLNPFTFDTHGTPNSGSIAVSTPSAAYYLLGNPYPSQVQWSNLTRSGVNDYFWILDETLQDYAFWDQGTGSGTGKLSGTGGVINSSQGFMVESTGGGSLTFDETDKVTTNVAFVRQAMPENLVMFHFGRNGRQVGMENMLHFVAGASNEKDGADMGYPTAPFLTKRYEAKTLTLSGKELCKNTLNLSDSRHDVPVVFRAAEPGSYTLSFDHLANLKGYSCIMLEDLVTGNFIDLAGSDTYTFDCSESLERHFVIHFSKTNESMACVEKSKVFAQISSNTQIASKVFAAGNSINVALSNNEIKTTDVKVYNSVGQLVYARAHTVGANFEFELPAENGVYFVVLSREGRTETHKVSVN
jgi:hypothetical protein